MEQRLAGKSFVVTCAASGIGLSTAQALLAQGASVMMWDISEKALEGEISKLPRSQQTRVASSVVNITKRSVVAKSLDEAKSKFGTINGIANFAGTLGHKLGHEYIWETSDEEFDFIINFNVRGLYNLLTEALKPGYLPEPGGSFIHISNESGQGPVYKGAVFSASRRAATGMVSSAARDCGSRGLRVNCVLPGINSRAGDPAPIPIPRPGRVEETSSTVTLWLSDESSVSEDVLWEVAGEANA